MLPVLDRCPANGRHATAAARRCRLAIAVALVALQTLPGTSVATPFVPASDDVVLEHLPEKGNPALAELKRMRAALATDPQALDLALAVAQRALDAGRRRGDPRFLGQAQAALAPWWNGSGVPAAALLLRATLKQAQHDFAGALADLDALVAADAANAQALLTRATVRSVVGRYREARDDCAALSGRVPQLVVAACDAVPASLSGDAAAAYERLAHALGDPRAGASIRQWASTLAAEIAARRGDAHAAELHFRAAFALDPDDAYLKATYADFLLDCDRASGVVALLADDTRNDALLLRLALAEQRLPERRVAFAAHRAELAARFDAAQRRGDATHRREEARFRLSIEGDARAAVRLARDNFAEQREPADVRILVEAATAARDADALALANRWAQR